METITKSERATTLSWGETAAGALPLIVMTLATLLEGGTQGSLSTALLWIFFFALYAVALGGVLKAWEQGFPPWSPPYLGLLVVDIALLRPLMFDPLFLDISPMLTLRLSILLLLVFFVIGAARLMRRGAGQTHSPAGLDWTAFLFGAQVWMPFIVMVNFDEIPVAAKAPLTLACGAILLAGALAHLRARSRWVGALALALSMGLAWWCASYLAGWYWGAHPWGG